MLSQSFLFTYENCASQISLSIQFYEIGFLCDVIIESLMFSNKTLT